MGSVVGSVVVPGPACNQPFASRDGRRVPDNDHEILVSADLHVQNTKAIVLTVPLFQSFRETRLVAVG